ncbi:mitochondrial genome maintenance exonuclease 1-like [Vespa mandarinia]|uniref:mitochondrial genome maintenance exonuclease 1-like n=1 Tax=Vespa mandarinia TaxID=7446 RepID=UPI001620404F|nr:mitochondrial genome maintenance exonuclease 1-like [Vespa mandarinia]
MKITQVPLYHHIFVAFPRNVIRFFSACNGDHLSRHLLGHKTRNISALHRKRREEKFMYGPLNKERKKTGKILSDDSNSGKSRTMDSELWWHLKFSKSKVNLIEPSRNNSHNIAYKRGRQIKHIKLISKNPLFVYDNDKIDTKKDIIKSKRSKDHEEIKSRCDKEHGGNENDDTATMIAIPNDFKSFKEKDMELPDVRLNNINHYPIVTDEKEEPMARDKLEILTVSLEDETEALYYPSVTKILFATMLPQAQKALEFWKKGMIKRMGEEKFNEYQQNLLNDGTEFHSCIEGTLLGKKVDIPKHIYPAYDSLSDVINELEDIRAVESFVSHKDLYYKGKIDCIASFRGELYAIDWKKSDKDKENINSMYDAPIQLAAYIGAVNSSKRYPFTINHGLIAVGYTTGKPADTYVVSDKALETYWKKWLMKLKQYWSNVKNQ